MDDIALSLLEHFSWVGGLSRDGKTGIWSIAGYPRCGVRMIKGRGPRVEDAMRDLVAIAKLAAPAAQSHGGG